MAKKSVSGFVSSWARSMGASYADGAVGALDDLVQHGLVSGIVSELIYTADVYEFYKEYLEDIEDIITGHEDDVGELTRPKELAHLDNVTFRVYLAVELEASNLCCALLEARNKSEAGATNG